MLSTIPVIEIDAGSANDSRAAEIYRNLQVLYGTVAGEQALDRDFGIDGAAIDFPSETAQELLAAEYVRKTRKYEPRANVMSVSWKENNGSEGFLRPKVVIEIV
jgi:hypothetical protein